MEIGISLSNTSVLATPETLLGMADKAEELGFASIWVGDHIALPYTLRQPYPYSRGAPSRAWIAESPIYDPVVLMSVIAGRTQRLKVAVGVLVLPYRHGVLTAKMAATLDVLSGGRLLLGVGIGWMSEEFDVMGMRFSERGAVTDEQIRLFRELWYKEKPEFHGKYYNMAGMTFLPRPRGKIPILVGGNTLPALRRAARLGDGVNLLELTPQELPKTLDQLRQCCAEANRPYKDLMITMRWSPKVTEERLDPSQRPPLMGSLDQILDDLKQIQDLGVTHVSLGARGSRTLATTLASMEEMAQAFRPVMG